MSGCTIEPLAPQGDTAVEYDRRHLPLYAALLDAEDSGIAWTHAAATLMGLDTEIPGAKACWRSHLARARWIIGDGLGSALVELGARRLA
jgi:hypothetical protein